jgi:hypothetical protein
MKQKVVGNMLFLLFFSKYYYKQIEIEPFNIDKKYFLSSSLRPHPHPAPCSQNHFVLGFFLGSPAFHGEKARRRGVCRPEVKLGLRGPLADEANSGSAGLDFLTWR